MSPRLQTPLSEAGPPVRNAGRRKRGTSLDNWQARTSRCALYSRHCPGIAVPALDITGTPGTAVIVLFIADQWGIPGIVWLGEGFGLLFMMSSGFLWSGALIVSMLIMLYKH